MKIGRNDPCFCGSSKKYKKCCGDLVETEEYTVFCDESGNSGGNYLDVDQPFFIEAGWIVPVSQLNNVKSIEDCAKKLNVTDEIHGKNLIRNRRNQRIFTELFIELGKQGCTPTFVFAEKKYCVSAKIIETLFDPVYNELTGNEYTYDNKMKKEKAELFYTLPFDILRDFATAYEAKDISLMSESIKNISENVTIRGEVELSKQILESLKYIEENMHTEKQVIDSQPKKVMASLNVPIFASLNNMLKKFGRSIDAELTLIHDETKQFREAYPETFNIFAHAKQTEFQLTDGNSIVLGFKKLKKFEFCNSKNNYWIQAADMLSSALSRSLKTLYYDEEMTDELSDLIDITLPTLFIPDVRIADSICSDDFRAKLFNILLNNFRKEPQEGHVQ